MGRVAIPVHTVSSLSHLTLRIPSAKHHTCKRPYFTDKETGNAEVTWLLSGSNSIH